MCIHININIYINISVCLELQCKFSLAVLFQDKWTLIEVVSPASSRYLSFLLRESQLVSF